jgi:hypothetical protein
MKNLKLKSLMLTLLAMMAVSMMCVSLTACGDDDDDKGGSDWPAKFSQTFKDNGAEFAIDEVIIEKLSAYDVDYYSIMVQAGGRKIRLSIPTASVDKVLDLTKDQRISQKSPVTASIASTYAYGDESFAQGSTLRVSVSGNTVKIVAKGKAIKDGNSYNTATQEINPGKSCSHTFELEYSGSYTPGKSELK